VTLGLLAHDQSIQAAAFKGGLHRHRTHQRVGAEAMVAAGLDLRSLFLLEEVAALAKAGAAGSEQGRDQAPDRSAAG
jgi:hypothetical protein